MSEVSMTIREIIVQTGEEIIRDYTQEELASIGIEPIEVKPTKEELQSELQALAAKIAAL